MALIARRYIFNRNLIAHLTQLFSDFAGPFDSGRVYRETLVKDQKNHASVAGNVGCFAGLLNRHPELDHIEKKLKQVLVLVSPPWTAKDR
jgi:hypothetical protein